jgi:DNA-binding phage protein
MTLAGLDPWIPCPCCDCYLCTIHGAHAHDCPCPPIEEWETDPYGAEPVTLAERLQRLFDDHDTNANAVATSGRLDRNAVYKIARGENTNPKLETLRAIVEAAGGTLGELFRDD